MKKGLIAFAIYFGVVAIVAALDMLGLPIIPEGVTVSFILVLATHLPAWLYLVFSRADAVSAFVAFVLELFSRIIIMDTIEVTISVFSVGWWLFVISWLYLRERDKRHYCDLRRGDEPCEFCAFGIAKENLKKDVEKWEEDADA